MLFFKKKSKDWSGWCLLHTRFIANLVCNYICSSFNAYKIDYSPFKHSRTRTVDITRKSLHMPLSTRSKDLSPEKQAFQFRNFSPSHKYMSPQRNIRGESRSPRNRSPQGAASSTLTGFKPVFRSAYIKPTKGSVTNYVSAQGYIYALTRIFLTHLNLARNCILIKSGLRVPIQKLSKRW